jgi:hypothetical protein
MAVYSGKGGSVTVENDTILGSGVNSWSVTTLVDVADSTNMSDVWASNERGLSDFNGTIEADSSIGADYPDIVGAAAQTFTFSVVSGGPNLSGDMLVTSITETASIEDVGKLSVSLEGSDTTGLVLAP